MYVCMYATGSVTRQVGRLADGGGVSVVYNMPEWPHVAEEKLEDY